METFDWPYCIVAYQKELFLDLLLVYQLQFCLPRVVREEIIYPRCDFLA